MSEGKSKIFLLDEQDQNKKLTTLEEIPYEKEEYLQKFLADYPDLLPGDKIATPARRWLLVSRETSVPDSAESGGRWSLDHLFLDQDGIPTFVECKRSSDTRGRREVVAQMLDYAANGVAYWKPGFVRSEFEERCRAEGKQAADVLGTFLAADDQAGGLVSVEDVYWEKVDSNLHERRIRLIFVADRIAPELKRLVEFLNEELSNVEVLAVEVRQYYLDGHSHRVLVPELVGATTLARTVKERAPNEALDHERLLDLVSGPARPVFNRLLEVVEADKALRAVTEWSPKGFSIRLLADASGKRVTVLYGIPPDKIQYYLDTPMLTAETRQGLRSALVQSLPEAFCLSGQHAANWQLGLGGEDKALSAVMDALRRAREALDHISAGK